MTVYDWEVCPDSGEANLRRARAIYERRIESLKYQQIVMPNLADSFQEQIDRLTIQKEAYENGIKNIIKERGPLENRMGRPALGEFRK